MAIDWATFDAALDEHQEREREAAEEAEARGEVLALRRDAEIRPTQWRDIRLGDFTTAEPEAAEPRFVKIVALRQEVESMMMEITFETPEPIGVGMHSHFVIKRPEVGRAWVDAAQPEEVRP